MSEQNVRPSDFYFESTCDGQRLSSQKKNSASWDQIQCQTDCINFALMTFRKGIFFFTPLTMGKITEDWFSIGYKTVYGNSNSVVESTASPSKLWVKLSMPTRKNIIGTEGPIQPTSLLLPLLKSYYLIIPRKYTEKV